MVPVYVYCILPYVENANHTISILVALTPFVRLQEMTMKTSSPSRPDDEPEEGFDSVESAENQEDEEEGVIAEDGAYSVSSCSERGSQRGLTSKQKAAQTERSFLGKQESKAISYLRWLVLLLLIIVGATFASLVFHFIHEQQSEEFDADYWYYAEQVTDSFTSHLKRTLDAQDTLSTTITLHALDTESVLPFMTLPSFEVASANARITGDVPFVWYMPYVKEEMRVEWEAYAAAHRDHNATAYVSEQLIKEEQDESFGMETPAYEGIALEAIKNSGGSVNTSMIWPPRENVTQVSWYTISRDTVSSEPTPESQLTYSSFVPRTLHTSRSGNCLQSYLLISTIWTLGSCLMPVVPWKLQQTQGKLPLAYSLTWRRNKLVAWAIQRYLT